MKKYAFLCPGQGSQSIGMCADLAPHFPVIQSTFEEASQVLGYSLWDLCQTGPVELLNSTERTQPAILTASVALWRVWTSLVSVAPSVLAGHSLGEFSALVCAGALSLQEAVRLVADRGRFMQEAVPVGEGKMAAVLGLDDESVIRVCASIAPEGAVVAANFNAPMQVIIAGQATAVDAACEAAKVAGAKRVVVLPMSVPSHCPMMAPASLRLKNSLDNVSLKATQIPVIHNVDALAHREVAAIKTALVNQLTHPVPWVKVMQSCAAYEVECFIESGPGAVLMGLNKRITDVPTKSLQSYASLMEAVAFINSSTVEGTHAS